MMFINNGDDKLAQLPHDIHTEILHHMSLQTIGQVAQLSKYWRQMANPTARVTSLDLARRKRISALRRHNVLEDLLKYSGPAFLTSMVENPNITFDIIARYPTLDWEWKCISTNPNISLELLLDLINICKIPRTTEFIIDRKSAVTKHELIKHGLLCMVRVSAMTVTEYLNDKCEYSSSEFQKLGNISQEDILTCKAIEWNYANFKGNKNLSIEFLYNYRTLHNEQISPSEIYIFRGDPIYGPKYEQLLIDAINNGDLILNDWIISACSASFSYATLVQNPQLCDWISIFSVNKFPFDAYIKHFDRVKRWISLNEIIELPSDATVDHPWLQYIKMRFENKLTIDVVMANRSLPWVWRRLAECETLSICDLLNIAPITKDFMLYVSCRSDLTIDVIAKYAHLPWNWYGAHFVLGNCE